MQARSVKVWHLCYLDSDPSHVNLCSEGLTAETFALYHTELSSMEVNAHKCQSMSFKFFNSISHRLLQLALLAGECSHCTTDALIYPAQQEGHSDPDRALIPNILTLVTT